MHLDRSPIPIEALPPGWGPAARSERRIVYRSSRSPIELLAVCTDPEESHPEFGVCWELRVRRLDPEYDVVERIGRVSTRSAALRGLLAAMHRLHEELDDHCDQIALGRALESISLDGLRRRVPTAP